MKIPAWFWCGLWFTVFETVFWMIYHNAGHLWSVRILAWLFAVFSFGLMIRYAGREVRGGE